MTTSRARSTLRAINKKKWESKKIKGKGEPIAFETGFNMGWKAGRGEGRKCAICRKSIDATSYFGCLYSSTTKEIYFHWTYWLAPYSEFEYVRRAKDELIVDLRKIIAEELKRMKDNEKP